MKGKLSTVGLVKITAKTKFEDGYLYLMWETGNKYVKIGRSNNPDRRKGELSKTNMPYDIFLLRKIKVSDYKKAEDAFHKIYEEFRFKTEDKSTEYFDLNPMELNYLMLIDRSVIEDICSGRVKWPSGTIKPLMKHYDRFLEGPDSPYAEMESARQAERISDLSVLVDQLRAQIVDLEGELTRLKVDGITGMASTENRVRAALRALNTNLWRNQPMRRRFWQSIEEWKRSLDITSMQYKLRWKRTWVKVLTQMKTGKRYLVFTYRVYSQNFKAWMNLKLRKN